MLSYNDIESKECNIDYNYETSEKDCNINSIFEKNADFVQNKCNLGNKNMNKRIQTIRDKNNYSQYNITKYFILLLICLLILPFIINLQYCNTNSNIEANTNVDNYSIGIGGIDPDPEEPINISAHYTFNGRQSSAVIYLENGQITLEPFENVLNFNENEKAYTFEYWYVEGDETKYYPGDVYTAAEGTEEVIFCAMVSFTIDLGDNSSGEQINLKIMGDKPTVTKITPPTKEGYNFLGYYKEDNTTSQQYIDSEGNVNQDSSLYSTPFTTLYAQWEEVTYNIDYYIVLDGVSTKWSEGNTNALTYTISTSSFSINLPTVDSRYEYLGWSSTEGGATTATTPTINQGTTGNKSYYFVYETKNLTLKLNCTNYSKQNYFVYIYRGSEIIYQLYVQKGVTLELGYIDYTQEKYTVQFVMSYLGSVSCSGENITQSGRKVTINEFVDTTINYTIISPNINGGIIV